MAMVTLDQGTLTIRGERKEEQETKDGGVYCCERWAGAFTRTMALPAGVDPEKIQASFKNGVLEVRLPKTAEAKGKKIEIKAA
jgi:HSP20 family protein